MTTTLTQQTIYNELKESSYDSDTSTIANLGSFGEENEETYNTTHNVFMDPDTRIAYKNKGTVYNPEMDSDMSIGQFRRDGTLALFNKK
jgi:hypothetical protein